MRRKGVADLLLGRVRLRVEQVRADGVVEQVGVLGHDPDRLAERGEGYVTHVGAVQAHRPVAHVVKPRDEVADRGLTGT